MRPDRAAVLLAAGVVLALTSIPGCSRMTFVKPDASRGAFTRTAPQVEIRPEGRQRSQAFVLVQIAQARLLEGKAEEARAAASEAVRLRPDSPEANSLVALALDALGRSRESGTFHRRAAELQAGSGALLNNYGIWLCAAGRAAESLEWFDRAATAPGYDAPDAALANAGTCALRMGNTARAERDFRRALELAPANPAALIGMARIEYDAGRHLQARAFVQRRLAAAAADPDALVLASQIEQQLGDTAAAARYVETLRTEFPRSSGTAREGGNQ